MILDSNVLIDFFNGKYESQVFQLLRKDHKIIIPSVVINELCRKLTKNSDTIKHELNEKLGNRFNYLDSTNEILNYSVFLLNKYPKVHSPDNIIISTAKKENQTLLTNDYEVQECCKKEKIMYYDHRHTKQINFKKIRLLKSLGNHTKKDKRLIHSEEYYLQ